MQRGYFVLLVLVAVAAIALFTQIISPIFRVGTNIGMAVSAAFGIVLVWASAPMVKRGTERIDRAFFRSAYDARVILQDLAEKARAVKLADILFTVSIWESPLFGCCVQVINTQQNSLWLFTLTSRLPRPNPGN